LASSTHSLKQSQKAKQKSVFEMWMISCKDSPTKSTKPGQKSGITHE